MAQFSHRSVTNHSDHEIGGVPAGATVSGGGMGPTDMAVTITTLTSKGPDGAERTNQRLSAEVLAGTNNKDAQGNVLNKVPNIGPGKDGEPARDASNQLVQEVTTKPGGEKAYNTSIGISPKQGEGFTAKLSAATGGAPTYSVEGETNGVKFKRETYVVNASMVKARDSYKADDGTERVSQGALPKMDSIQPSKAAVPATEQAFRDAQKAGREELKQAVASGELTAAKIEPEKGKTKAAEAGPKPQGERSDVLVRVDLNKDGTIPQSAPNKNGFQYTHGQMLKVEPGKDGTDNKFSYTAPSVTDERGQKHRDNFFDKATLTALMDKGSVAETSWKAKGKDGVETERKALLISANVELTAPNKNGRQSVNLKAGVEPSKTMPEVTPDSWKQAKDSMRADYEAAKSAAPKGYSFAQADAAAKEAPAPKAPDRSAERPTGALRNLEENLAKESAERSAEGDYGDD